MPAHPSRKLIAFRMRAADIKRLDKLVVDESRKTGRILDRSKVLNLLVERAYAKLNRRGNAAA